MREITGDEFCFFVDIDRVNFETLASAMKENGIEVVGVPYYSRGVTYATAGRADGRKVYIRYKDIDKAKEIYENIGRLFYHERS